MYPQKLPPARPQSHWTHAGSFGSGVYVEAFTHRHYDIGMHTHDFMEVNLVLAGAGRHYIGYSGSPVSGGGKTNAGQRWCDARPGCVFVIPAGIRHGYRDGGGLDVWHLLVHRAFIPRCAPDIPRLPGYAMLCEIEPFLRGRSADGLFLILSGGELGGLLGDIRRMELFGGPEAEIMKRHTAAHILATLCFYMGRGRAGIPGPQDAGLCSVARCLEWIHCHYDEKITVDLLAERANLSRSTLIRKFRDICGCAPAAYISRYRLQKAKEMKQEKKRSLTEIAHACGFYDLSHMERTEKRLGGA